MKRILLAGLLALVCLAARADIFPISPVAAGTKTISCTNTTAATALPGTILQQGQLELQNAGTAVIFVEVGASTVTAVAATAYPILVGQSKVITVPQDITHIACIVGASTHTLYVTVGRGN